MLFPNQVQAALLFDQRVDKLEATVRDFMRIEEARTGARFNMLEAKPGVFYRLFGGDELMITLEYVDGPANVEVFRASLASAVTGLICPDIRHRLTRNRSHILVNVSHGALGDSAELRRLLDQIGSPPKGHSLPQFERRLAACALISRIVCDHAPAQAVHWTQSDQIVPGEAFETFAAGSAAPGPLHVHPFLFGRDKSADGKPKLGIRTFGARHFIGREVLVQPSVLPWTANYDTILAFLKVATTKNGYVIPDGDTFGPEDRSLSYRVTHLEAEEGDVPLFELVPLLHREHGFVAQDYVPPERVFDDRMPPVDLMPEDVEAKMELVNEWREKRALAEGIGGRFEVRSRDVGGRNPPARPGGPPAGGFGNRPVFGRKRAD